MPLVEEIHVNDVGTIFRISLVDVNLITQNLDIADISAATGLNIIFQKPDSSTFSKDAAFTTDGTNGQLEYTSVSGDIDAVGQWKLQSIVKMTGEIFHSEIKSFKVYRNL